MTNPDNAASHSEKTFETKVTEALNAVKRGEDGKLEFPEGTPEDVVFAATSEQRRRDTQAEFTKARQSNAALKAEKDELLKHVSNSVKPELTAEQLEELEELKFSDPDEWRHKLNTYESEARAKQDAKMKEQLKEVSAKGTKTAELERRHQVLQEFQAANPGLVLTDEVIANDVPPRITKKLENNECTFEEFLQEVHDYLNAGKVVATTEKVLDQPNLSKAGGSDTPSDEAVGQATTVAYDKEVY